MKKIPVSGEFYKSYQGKMYQIIAVGKRFDTGEHEVVFQELFGVFEKYTMKLESFCSVNSEGKALFEPIEMKKTLENASTSSTDMEIDKKNDMFEPVVDEQGANSEIRLEKLFLAFLDANTSREKIDYLERMKPEMTERVINNIAASMDLPIDDSNIEGQYDMILENLKQRSRFECDRLR